MKNPRFKQKAQETYLKYALRINIVLIMISENEGGCILAMLGEGLIAYSYNDLHFYKDPNIPDHEKVVCKEHDPYVEAIVGAVYYDSNYDTTRRWILKWLLPLLEHYK